MEQQAGHCWGPQENTLISNWKTGKGEKAANFRDSHGFPTLDEQKIVLPPLPLATAQFLPSFPTCLLAAVGACSAKPHVLPPVVTHVGWVRAHWWEVLAGPHPAEVGGYLGGLSPGGLYEMKGSQGPSTAFTTWGRVKHGCAALSEQFFTAAVKLFLSNGGENQHPRCYVELWKEAEQERMLRGCRQGCSWALTFLPLPQGITGVSGTVCALQKAARLSTDPTSLRPTTGTLKSRH